jgi:hypothetical protein
VLTTPLKELHHNNIVKQFNFSITAHTQGLNYNPSLSLTGPGMARANPGYIEHEGDKFTGARPKRPTLPILIQHQPSQPESLRTPPALEDLPPDVYKGAGRPQQAPSTYHLTSLCYAIRLMQAQLDDRYTTMDEVRQAAADSATVPTTSYFAADNLISTTTPHNITRLEADVVMLNKQLLDLGDKWNYFATKYSEAKDQLVAAKLHSEQISTLLQEATSRLHEAELDKTLTQFHLKLSESGTAYYKKTCDELKEKLEDVVKSIKATEIAIVTPQVTTILPMPVSTTTSKDSSFNEIVSAYYVIGLTIFFLILLFFFLIAYPIVCKDAPASVKPRTILIFSCMSSSYPISPSIQNRQRAFLTTSCTGLSLHLLYGPQHIFNIFTRLL